MLADSGVFGEGIAVSEIDVLSLAADRRRMSTFEVAPTPEDYKHLTTYFSLEFDGEGGNEHAVAVTATTARASNLLSARS